MVGTELNGGSPSLSKGTLVYLWFHLVDVKCVQRSWLVSRNFLVHVKLWLQLQIWILHVFLGHNWMVLVPFVECHDALHIQIEIPRFIKFNHFVHSIHEQIRIKTFKHVILPNRFNATVFAHGLKLFFRFVITLLIIMIFLPV